MKSTGAASGIHLGDDRALIPSGRSGMHRRDVSRTSCAATSMSFSSWKLMITCETPSVEIERSSSMPLMVLTASSIFR